MRKTLLTLLALGMILLNPNGFAQQENAANWTAASANHFLIYPDQVYGTASGMQLKLDVWQNQDSTKPAPTVIFIHGGGWVFGDRSGAVPQFLPYVQKNWHVVNVEYRMASQAAAPAAVEDVRCALRWVYRNADKFHFDTDRIIVTGQSAGGHLALMTGLLQESDGLDSNCPSEPAFGEKPLKVAAIVNWFGISDVASMLSGPDRRTYAIEWIGSQPNGAAVAKRVSPLTYIRSGLPPVITIHGDSDPVVPYSNGVNLHHALDKAGVPNQLVTIVGGKHGFQAFDDAHNKEAYEKIFAFLYAHVPGLK